MALIGVGLCWVIGLLPVGLWGAPWWMGAAWLAASGPVALSVGPLKRRWKLGAAGLGASAIAGLLLAQSGTGQAPAWVNLTGADVTIEGVVRSEPNRGLTTTTYEVRVDRLTTAAGGQARGGIVLAMLNQYDRYLPGDHLVLEGELDPAAGEASEGYRAYLARRGVGGRMFRPRVASAAPGDWSLNHWLTNERLAFDRALQRSLPEPEASLAAGIAFGRADGLSTDVESTFNDTGLRHLVAVSGSNVSLVTALMYILFVPVIGRKSAWIPAGLALVAYLGAAGLSPSVLRSGLMALTFLAGSVIGRPQSGLPGLCAAVIVMTAWSPPIARDPGFILSATATAGILAFYPNLHAALRLLTRRQPWLAVPNWVLQAASLTIAATIATTPVMWVLFGRVSLVSPLANVVVEPVFVLAFWGSMATAGVARVSPEAGILLGDVAYYPLAFILGSAREFARVPLASVAVPAGASWVAAASYMVLTPVAFLSYRYSAHLTQEPRRVEKQRAAVRRFFLGAAAGVAVVGFLSLTVLRRPGNGDLTVTFLDVGQGDAAMIVTPHGRQVLLDAGPSGLGVVRELSAVMPHWDRSIDLAILSHPEEDHMGGFPEVRARYAVGGMREAGTTSQSTTYHYLAAAFPAAIRTEACDSFTIDGVEFKVLWPPAGASSTKLNDASLVIHVTFGETSFLFTGDSEAPVHRALMQSDNLHADVLKVPHHGSKTADPALFPAVAAKVAVISVGKDNTYGHPNPDILSALEPARVLRTDESGRVTIRSDGRTLRINTQR